MIDIYALPGGLEHGLRIRHASDGGKNPLLMGHLWFADWEGLVSHLVSPNTEQAYDKRQLQTTLSGQLQWLR